MRNRNKLDEWLNNPCVKKHLQKFTYSVDDGGGYRILYDGLVLLDICEIIGCFVMGVDPYFYRGYVESVIDKVNGIYSLPPWERAVIVELFEYLDYECPRKKVKLLIGEYVDEGLDVV